MLLNIHYIMNKKLLILIILTIFCIGVSISSVSAIENSNSTDDLDVVDDSDSVNTLNSVEREDSSENLSKSDDSDSLESLGVCESSSDENLSAQVNSSSDVLTSSVSVSSGHTYYKCGYTFKVSSNQYKKIRQAINAGKKQTFLDEGFRFSVKTNNVIKTKVVVKTKTYYKKVRYEGLTKYPYNTIKLANLKSYYNSGWKKYATGYEIAKNSNKYLGYNFVKLKKTVKTYKTISMRVYATISYEGDFDYVYGPHYYYPIVSFYAKKSGYSTKYLTGDFLK